MNNKRKKNSLDVKRLNNYNNFLSSLDNSLNNINNKFSSRFDEMKQSIRSEKDIKYELDKIVSFLKLNPSIKIEINGHTDNVGASTYNLNLSKNM
jgi:outer membrane protein OmpA-like peptidoglycan-associated protein